MLWDICMCQQTGEGRAGRTQPVTVELTINSASTQQSSLTGAPTAAFLPSQIDGFSQKARSIMGHKTPYSL